MIPASKQISHVREHPYLLLGHFEPIESTMPYPLQQQHFENRIEDRIDKVVLQNLKVLCKGEKEETILEAIYSPECVFFPFIHRTYQTCQG